jgi:hypothetical protein
MLNEIVQPERDPLLYGDNVDVTAAMQAGQIDAALFDLPTALYLAAVVVNDGVILGQFPATGRKTLTSLDCSWKKAIHLRSAWTPPSPNLPSLEQWQLWKRSGCRKPPACPSSNRWPTPG